MIKVSAGFTIFEPNFGGNDGNQFNRKPLFIFFWPANRKHEHLFLKEGRIRNLPKSIFFPFKIKIRRIKSV